MIGSIAILLMMQLIGTFIAKFAHLPLPGPVVGMVLLFAFLLWRGGVPKPLAQTTKPLLDHLALLFVPAGVGIIAYWHAASGQLVALALVLVVGFAITIVATAWTLHWLLGRRTSQTAYGDDKP